MNKQPFYHEVTVLFTGTRAFTREELEELIFIRKNKDIVPNTFQIDSVEADPGDPADLM